MTGAILVVDDDADTAAMVRDALIKRGFAARAALSAQAGLDELRTWPADVVITDVNMAGMTGIELCHALHRDHPGVLPIVITGAAGVETAV